MFQKLIISCLIICSGPGALSQVLPDTAVAGVSAPNKNRTILVAGGHAAFLAGSYIVLNQAWYADYERESFHFFNDNKEWLQMDKVGHVWSNYQIARASGAIWKWAGMKPRKAALLGSVSAVAYQSIIEIQDAFSAEWGFSWGDMTANLAGAGIYLGQELGWREQRLQIKFSSFPHKYGADLTARRNELFGKSGLERILKDYNSQTYWLSANIASFFPDARVPGWLNVSLGYGAEGLLGGFENKWTEGTTQIDKTDIKRNRRFFLSVDADLTKIRTRSKFLRSVFFAVNAIKIPAPAIELNQQGRFKLHGFYF